MKSREEIQKEAARRLEAMLNSYWQEEFIRRYELTVTQATLSRWASGQQAIPLHILVHLGIIEFT